MAHVELTNHQIEKIIARFSMENASLRQKIKMIKDKPEIQAHFREMLKSNNEIIKALKESK